jgi:hypothetical protein
MGARPTAQSRNFIYRYTYLNIHNTTSLATLGLAGLQVLGCESLP